MVTFYKILLAYFLLLKDVYFIFLYLYSYIKSFALFWFYILLKYLPSNLRSFSSLRSFINFINRFSVYFLIIIENLKLLLIFVFLFISSSTILNGLFYTFNQHFLVIDPII